MNREKSLPKRSYDTSAIYTAEITHVKHCRGEFVGDSDYFQVHLTGGHRDNPVIDTRRTPGMTKIITDYDPSLADLPDNAIKSFMPRPTAKWKWERQGNAPHFGVLLEMAITKPFDVAAALLTEAGLSSHIQVVAVKEQMRGLKDIEQAKAWAKVFISDRKSEPKAEQKTEPTPTTPHLSADELRTKAKHIVDNYDLGMDEVLAILAEDYKHKPQLIDPDEVAKSVVPSDGIMYLDRITAICQRLVLKQVEADKAVIRNTPLDPAVKKLQEATINVDESETSSDEVMDAEVIEPPAPARTNAEKVADLISAAFPDSSKEYKQSIFKSATSCDSVAAAEEKHGSSTMFELLKAEIAQAQGLVHNLPPAPPDLGARTIAQTAIDHLGADPALAGAIAANAIESARSSKPAPSSETALVTTAPQSPAALPKPETALLSNTFRVPSPEEFAYMQNLARCIAISNFYKGFNTPEKALIPMMEAYALNVNPFSYIAGIDIVPTKDGGFAMYRKPILLMALANNLKVFRRFEIIPSPSKCTITAQRKDRDKPSVYVYTIEMAQQANLTNKKAWQDNPQAMLVHRCTRWAVMSEAPECIFSFGNLSEGDDEDVPLPRLEATAQ